MGENKKIDFLVLPLNDKTQYLKKWEIEKNAKNENRVFPKFSYFLHDKTQYLEILSFHQTFIPSISLKPLILSLRYFHSSCITSHTPQITYTRQNTVSRDTVFCQKWAELEGGAY